MDVSAQIKTSFRSIIFPLRLLLALFGLVVSATIAQAVTVATPTFSPAAGTYTAAQTVTISTTTSGASIRYTTDGSTPSSTAGTLYSSAVSISATATLKAIGFKTGDTNSAVTTGIYTINLTAAAPTFSPVAGTYSNAQTVTISSTTSGASIRYTTDGSTPSSTAGTLYASPVSIGATATTLKAIAFKTGFANSAVTSGIYTLTVAAPTFSPVAGTYSNAQTVTITSATSGASIRYTTNGTAPTTTTGTVYSGPIALSTTTTLEAIAFKTGYGNSTVTSGTYTLTVAAPAFSPAAGTYTTVQTVTITSTTSGASIRYTTNGTAPTTTTGTVYSGPVAIGATTTLEAIAFETGFNNSAVTSGLYTINVPKAATPTFSPVAGTYTTVQTVTISSTTTGASIAYTTDGTTPTESGGTVTHGTLYGTALSISATTTLEAIAFKTGDTDSAAASAKYTISLPVVAAPTFSPVAGTYTAAQTVTISSTTTGASIRYTTDGSTPSETAGTLYSGTVSIGATKTLKAIAYKTGDTDSSVTSGAYTINLPVVATPTFSPVAGTYTAAQTVTISSTTSGASIRYTTDGVTVPTETAGTLYSGTVSIAATTTLKAIAYKTGDTDSSVTSGVYTINLPVVAAPTFSPVAGTYTAAQTVTISSTTGASIRYTTDGVTAPTETVGTLYSSAIGIGATTTIKAIAYKTGDTDSIVTSGKYTITPPPPAAPVFSLAAGTYSTAQSVTITSTGATSIYYTTDGSTPTTSSTLYTGPVSIAATTTLGAIGVNAGGSGPATSKIYAIIPAPINLGGLRLWLRADAGVTADASGFVSTWADQSGKGNNATQTQSSQPEGYWQPSLVANQINGLPVIHFTQNQQTFLNLLTNPMAGASGGEAFVILRRSTTTSIIGLWDLGGSTGPSNGNRYPEYDGQIFDDFATNAWYATGPAPATSFLTNFHLYNVGGDATTWFQNFNGYPHFQQTGNTVAFCSNPTLGGGNQCGFDGDIAEIIIYDHVLAAADRAALATYLLNKYTIAATNPQAAAPVFSPATGTYTSAQTVTMTTPTGGARVAYTTDGSTPESDDNGNIINGTLYSGPVVISSTTTFNAIAFANGLTDSPATAGTYTINLQPAAAPVFSPAPGTYPSAQTVGITSTTDGARVAYTTDGSLPASDGNGNIVNGTLYPGPLAISAATILQAIAFEAGIPDSPATGGSYAIIPAPINLPGLCLWLNADTGVTTGANGFVWADQSGLGNDAFQTDAPAQPQLVAGAVNGHSVVRFGGAGILNLPGVMAGATAGEIIAVVKLVPQPDGNSNDLWRFGNIQGTGYYNPQVHYNDFGSADNQYSIPPPASALSQYYIFNTSSDGANWVERFNGSVQRQAGNEPVSFTQFPNLGNGNLTGDIVEVIVYNQVLSDAGRAAVNTYLTGKYAIALTNVNYQPVASNQSVTTQENTAVPITLAATQADNDSLIYTVASQPAHGALSGTAPNLIYTPAANYTGPDSFTFTANDGGVVDSNLATVSITVSTAAPTFSPPAGTYFATSVPVTISSVTSGASIAYTTDGSTPAEVGGTVTHGALYSAPVDITATTTLKALAFEAGFADSPVATAVYTIAPQVLAPTFTPFAGTYTSAPSVTISSATSGASIRYTTDGSTPTETHGTIYSGVVGIGSTTTLQAIAYKSGFTDSAVTSGTYTINLPPAITPVIPPGGVTIGTSDYLSLSFTATDSNGTVTSVVLSSNDAGIPNITLTSPTSGSTWTFTATSLLPPGTYTFTATAYNNFGGVTASTPVTVTVLPSLPYLTDFETSEGYILGSLNLQLGWTVNQGSASVTNADSFSGSQSVVLQPGAPPAQITQDFAPLAGQNIIFVDFYAKPVAESSIASATTFNVGSARFAFLLNAGQGTLQAFNGNGSGGGTWISTGFTTPLAANNESQNWIRLTVRLDFTHTPGTWDLYANGQMVAADQGFLNNASTVLASFSVQGDVAAASEIDDIFAGTDNPLFADVNNDGIPDSWESLYGLGTTTNDRYLDPTGNGQTVLYDYLHGLDPLDYYGGVLPVITSQVDPSGVPGTQGLVSVLVTNSGGTPLINAPITLAVTTGASTISTTPGGTGSASVMVPTNSSGVASAYVDFTTTASDVLVATAQSGSSNTSISINLIAPPISLSGLRLWLKADTGLSLGTGGNITTWADQSGQSGNNNLTQTSLSNEPTPVANALNGYPVVHFNGTSQYFHVPQSVLGSATAAEAFVVLRASSALPSARRALWYMGANPTAYPDTDGSIKQDFFSNSGAKNMGQPVPISSFHLFNVSSQANGWEARLNGILSYAANSNSVFSGFRSDAVLGADGYGGVQAYFAGDIAEVIIYSQVLTQAQRDTVNTYLGNKYGLYTAPPVPAGLSVVPLSPGQINLQWSAPLRTDHVNYLVERSTDGMNFIQEAVVPDALSYIDTGLTAGTTYTYRVRAEGYAGISGYSSAVAATTLLTGGGTDMPLTAGQGVCMWLRADADVAGGSSVAFWPDQSGLRNDVVQSSTSNQPTSTASSTVLNGHPVVHFNGTSQYFHVPLSVLGSATAAEAFVVLRVSSALPSARCALWYMGANSTAYPDTDGSIKQDFFSNSGVKNIGQPIPIDSFHLFNVGSQTNDWEARLNGTVYSATNSNSVFTGFRSDAVLGADGFGGVQAYFAGDIAEVIIYNRVLSPQERETVGFYLNSKYGLTSPANFDNYRDGNYDGLPDAVDRQLGFDPTSMDVDGDGYANLQEILEGSDPLNPLSVPPQPLPPIPGNPPPTITLTEPADAVPEN